jgi:Domain of unknown function (DUF1937)
MKDSEETVLTYLATPYTRYPGGHMAAFELACRSAAVFLSAGIPVFSPIAHSHPIAQFMPEERIFDHDLWVLIDAPMIAACDAMIVVTAEGWKESRGVQHEIARFKREGKPITYWTPGDPLPEHMRGYWPEIEDGP